MSLTLSLQPPVGTAVLFLLAVFHASAVPSAAQVDVAAGREVRIPRVDTQIEVDGVLDEPIWQRAAVLRGFSQYLPVDGRPAEDPTAVLVWYSPTAIYFGIRSYEAHSGVRATLADRDKIGDDDYIQILLDTFNDHREAFVFGVNPLGIQADGTLRDAARRGGSGFSAGGSGGYSIDLSPDFVYQSSGRLTDDGYEVEIRIPFKSLRYQSAREQNWGINVIRKVQHSGYEDTWSPVLQGSASFLSHNGTLVGLTELNRGIVLDLNPVTTSRITGERSVTGWDYEGGEPELSGSVRWGITNNLTVTGTANPDFSQVEADVAQVQFNPQSAVFFAEKRPFFLEGIQYFAMPNRLIHTRRLANPVAAVKLTGKVSGTSVALLSGVDAVSMSFTGTDNPIYNFMRLRKDVGRESTLGMAYTDKIDGDNYNRVVSADGRLVFASQYSVTFQGAASFTRRADARTAAPLWQLSVNKAGRTFGFSYSMRGIHPDFRAEGGFISRANIVNVSFSPRITVFGRPGTSLESWTGSIRLSGRWNYDRFFDGKTPNDPKLHFNSAFRLRGGWRVGTSLLLESFKYPPELYTDYAIESATATGTDTIPFTGTDRLYNLDLVMSVTTPQFQRFSGSSRIILGRDENFFEWAPANVFFVTVNANWRPTKQLRINARYNHQQYIRPSDWSTAGIRRIPRLQMEYQLSRAIFVRFVGQYDGEFRDSLRDDSRTNDPILIFSPAADAFVRAGREVENDLRVDWLFSYQPTPGTVFFAGYGSSLEEPESFRFNRLRRVADGFFFKLSYLFRM